MRTIEEYSEQYRRSVQEHVTDEQVLAVGVFTRVGGIAGAVAVQFSGAAFLATKLMGRSKAAGLPQNVVLAVTPTRLLAFGFRPKGMGIKVREQVAAWPRTAVRVELEGRTMTRRLRLDLVDGTSIELEAMRQLGSFDRLNDEFLARLGVPAGV